MAPETNRRLSLVEDLRLELDVYALLIQDPLDLRWITGFTGSNGLLLWSGTDRHFLTDGRYRDQALAEVRGAEVHVPGYDLLGFLQQGGFLEGRERIAVDSTSLTVATFERLREVFPSVEWVTESKLFSRLRSRKSEEEIICIRKAQHLAETVLREIVGLVHPGVTERDVASELTGRSIRGGADAMAFDPIVAAADRSALPHARPTDRPIAYGDPILLDFGCMVNGYASDMTRMISLGPPSEGFARVHALVAEAVAAAESAVCEGAIARDVDAAARKVIVDSGFGDRFPHSLGHGVGLSVHEDPSVSWRNSEPLQEDCVITLEPGIYLPGEFGVRIEDMVRVRQGGSDRITTLDRELIVL